MATPRKPTKKKPTKKPAKKSPVKKPAKKPLQLELESGRVIRDVKPRQILAAIENEEFGILATSARTSTYMQFADQDGEPWEHILEYQEGSTDRHYKAVHAGISIEAIAAVFGKYLRGDPTWKTDFTWERIDL